jgi:hypothetical protein
LNSYIFLEEFSKKYVVNVDFLDHNSTHSVQVSNPDSKLKPKSLDVNSNTSAVESLINSCTYPDFQYTDEELKSFWNYEVFSDCKSQSLDSVTIDQNKFVVHCSSGTIPEFFSLQGKTERLGGARKNPAVWEQSSPDISEISFAFIRCGFERIYSFTFLHQISSVSEKAKKLASENSLNQQSSSSSPFNVLLLTFDSISRGSAYRNLQKTMNYLKNGLKDALIYDFLNPGIPEVHTVDNMAQILYGHSKQKMQKELGTRAPSLNSKLHLNYQKYAIWTQFSQMGFVTLFIHDTVWNFLNTLTGFEILADHVFVNYWKAVWSVYGFTDYTDGQKCIGSENRHNIGLTYTKDFFEKYPENHKFAYVHLNPAHEGKGIVRTIDEDLLKFLNTTLKLFTEKKEDFVVFLIADHGQRRTAMQFDIRNTFESTQAMSFIITSKNLPEKVNSTLSFNSKYLFSRFDLNLSLKELSFFPFGGISNETYEKFKSTYETKDVLSLFKEKINPERTCKNLIIPYEMCPCSSFVDVSNNQLDINLFNNGFISMIFEYFLQTAKENLKCFSVDQVELQGIEKLVLFMQEDGWDMLYKLQVQMLVVNEVKNATVHIRGCTQKRIEKSKIILPDKKFSPLKYFYSGVQMFYQVYHVEVFSSCIKDCFCLGLNQ